MYEEYSRYQLEQWPWKIYWAWKNWKLQKMSFLQKVMKNVKFCQKFWKQRLQTWMTTHVQNFRIWFSKMKNMIGDVALTNFVMQILFTVQKKSFCIRNMDSMFFLKNCDNLKSFVLSCFWILKVNHYQFFHSKVEMGDACDKQLNLGNFVFSMRRIMNKNLWSFLDVRVIDLFSFLS